MRLGVTGCGAMGRPMAERLIAAGFEIVGHDVRPAAEFGGFARHMTPDPAELSRCDAVISVVRDAAQTRDAIRAIGNLPPVLIISSTLSPRFIRELREEVPAAIAMIDAPMSGAPHSARDGRLSFMLGGPDDAIDRLMPAFRAMGGVIHRLGPLGAGATAKVLNNFVAATCVAAVRTVLDQSGPLGLDPARLRAVMDTSSGGTWYGQNLDRIDWAAETYDASNTIGILEKDVTAYLDAITEGGSPDALTAAVLERLRTLPPLP
ncbi:MAG: NAD(P)-dependent oxidoreductase [Minwuia sp.]|uniref:NAD(P)-dependent oxidoreductase n=1 Tax=Minwuia sp. TaxID=2493630 RepID=UPI003A896335